MRDCPDRLRVSPAPPLPHPQTAVSGPACPVVEPPPLADVSEQSHLPPDPVSAAVTATLRDVPPLPSCSDDIPFDASADTATHPAPPPVAPRVRRLPHAPARSRAVLNRASETIKRLLETADELRCRSAPGSDQLKKRQPARAVDISRWH